MAYAGHFGYEIDKHALTRLAKEQREVRAGVQAYLFPDGRALYLLGDGEPVNLALGDGHPVEIMDISFALQALSLEYLARQGKGLPVQVHPVPPEIDEQVARMALTTLRTDQQR